MRFRRTTASRANLLYFNYPNNPTGAVATDGFFERAVAFAGERDLVAIHDSAYTEIAFDGYRPPSFLATPGRRRSAPRSSPSRRAGT